MSFDEFFSYLFRSEWKWIIYFPTIYVYCIYRGMSKSPKKLSKNRRNKRRSYRFDCVLCEVRAYKFISMNDVTVSYRRSTWIRCQKTISWSITKYNKKYPVNATAQIEQVQDKKTKTVTGRRRNTIKTSYVSILRLPSFYLY